MDFQLTGQVPGSLAPQYQTFVATPVYNSAAIRLPRSGTIGELDIPLHITSLAPQNEGSQIAEISTGVLIDEQSNFGSGGMSVALAPNQLSKIVLQGWIDTPTIAIQADCPDTSVPLYPSDSLYPSSSLSPGVLVESLCDTETIPLYPGPTLFPSPSLFPGGTEIAAPTNTYEVPSIIVDGNYTTYGEILAAFFEGRTEPLDSINDVGVRGPGSTVYNYIPNASFEYDQPGAQPASWPNSSLVNSFITYFATTRTWAYDGLQSARLTTNIALAGGSAYVGTPSYASGPNVVHIIPSPSTASTVLFVGFNVNILSLAPDAFITAAASWYDQLGGDLGSTLLATGSPNALGAYFVSGSVVPPINAAYLIVWIGFQGATSPGVCDGYFDAIVLTEGLGLPDTDLALLGGYYFDGDQNQGQWLSTVPGPSRLKMTNSSEQPWRLKQPKWFRDNYGRVYQNVRIYDLSLEKLPAIPTRHNFTMTLQVA